jgi:hypothetical protein
LLSNRKVLIGCDRLNEVLTGFAHSGGVAVFPFRFVLIRAHLAVARDFGLQIFGRGISVLCDLKARDRYHRFFRKKFSLAATGARSVLPKTSEA